MASTRSWLREHGFAALLAIACMALSAQVVVLAREVRHLKEARAAPATDPNGDLFRVGEPFFPFTYRDSAGNLQEVRFDRPAPKRLLLVLANACPVCPQALPRWEEVAPHFQAASVEVLGLLLDGPPPDDGPWIPGVPLGSFADLSRIPLAKLRTVPLTVLIDELGRIEWVHYGTLGDARLGELVSHLP